MKRRNFLVGSATMLGAVVPTLVRGQAVPCPPPAVGVDDKTPVTTTCGPTSLTELAAALSPGQSSTALGDTGLTSEALYTIQWCNRFHVDVPHGRAHLLGKNASSQGGERSNCLYNATTNTWSYAIYGGGGSDLGHVYESFGYDPNAGVIYQGMWASNGVRRWSYGSALDSWTVPATTSSIHLTNDVQPAMGWHPNLFGAGDGGLLVIANTTGNTAALVAWRKSTNTWSTVAGTTHAVSGDYPGQGTVVYMRGGGFAIAAFHPANGGNTYTVAAGSGGTIGTVTQINDVPLLCGYGDGADNVGILLDDPAGSFAYILEKRGSHRVWKLSGSSWILKGYAHPLDPGDIYYAVASVYPHGVFWRKHHSTSTPSRLWRPND
jgi:hypothetical protein